ncbi:MAG TPA: hypothetical protein VF349_06155 [Candidatus Limnocylindrales bacterium]
MTTDSRFDASTDARWLEQAARLLAGLGFQLVEPETTIGDETSHLLVALRPAPTLKHFDPESIEYWITEGARGRAARLDRDSRLPVASGFSWGRIALTDRLGVRNEFLSFGGALKAQMNPDATVLVDFGSNAPILRWSGHSQGTDPLAAEVGAFVGRLKVPIDFVPGAEAMLAKAAPEALYCAFIQSVRERVARARGVRDSSRWLADWSSREGKRMETTAADSWKAAIELRRQLEAMEAIARE